MIMEFQDQYQYTKNINIKLALNFENRHGWQVYSLIQYPKIYRLFKWWSTWHINFSAQCAYNMNCFLIFFFSLQNVTITEENTTYRNCTGFFLILNKLQAVLNYLHFVNTKDWRMYFSMKGLKHKLLDNEIKF